MILCKPNDTVISGGRTLNTVPLVASLWRIKRVHTHFIALTFRQTEVEDGIRSFWQRMGPSKNKPSGNLIKSIFRAMYHSDYLWKWLEQ